MNKEELSKKSKLLHLNSVALADGMKSGNFRSLYRGQGIDFSGVRDYFQGDDVRLIDWNVTARFGKPYVKIFDEEHELDVFIILDKSSSMGSYTGAFSGNDKTGNKKTKLDAAIECASLLILASSRNQSPVGCVSFDGKIDFSISPKSGIDHAMMMLSNLEKNASSKFPGSVLDNAIKGAERLLKKRSLVFIISDFRSSGWINDFARLSQKNDVVALKITDSFDSKLPSIGSVSFVDSETNFSAVLPTSSPKFMRKWNEDNENRIEQWKDDCIRHGGTPLLINAQNDCGHELVKFFSSREQIQ